MGVEASVDQAYSDAVADASDLDKISALLGFSSSFCGETSWSASGAKTLISSWSRDGQLDLALALRSITAPVNIGGGDGSNDDAPKGAPNFGVFRRPHESTTGGFVFDIMTRPSDRMAAMSATAFDARVSRFKPQLVPKYLTESEYFYNYFTHVCVVREAHFHGTQQETVHKDDKSGAFTFTVSGETFDTEAPELDGKSFGAVEELKAFLVERGETAKEENDDAAEVTNGEHQTKVAAEEEEEEEAMPPRKSEIESKIEVETIVAKTESFMSTGEVPSALPRFIRCEKGDAAKAAARWRDTLKFRAEYGMNDILKKRDPKFEFIMKHYPHYFHGRSLGGHPVYYEKLGEVNLDALKTGGVSIEALIWHYMQVGEYQWSVLEPRDDAQGITVLDCSGIGMTDLSGDVMGFIRKTNALYGKHFPEKAHKIYLVNTPFLFGAIWRLVRPFIDPVTVAKVNILRGQSYIKNELLKSIAPDQLPKEYGGTSQYALGEAPEHLLMVERLTERNDAASAEASPAVAEAEGRGEEEVAAAVNGNDKEDIQSADPRMLVVIEVLPAKQDISAASLMQLAKIVKSVKAEGLCSWGQRHKALKWRNDPTRTIVQFSAVVYRDKDAGLYSLLIDALGDRAQKILLHVVGDYNIISSERFNGH